MKDKGWLVSILFLGTLFRIIDIAKPFSGVYKWNEGHYAVTALNYFKYGLLLPMNEYGLDLTTSPLFSWLVFFSFRIFGVHEWVARLPSFIFGITSILLVYLISITLYKKRIALLATFFVAVAPGIVYYSRSVQLESMFTAFSLAALLFLMHYKNGKGIKYLILSGIFLSLSILTKYPALLTYPSLLWVWFRYGKFKPDRNLFFTYIVLPVVPAILWLAHAITLNAGLARWYFYKPDAPWSLGSALLAVYMAFGTALPDDFGYLFYYPLLVAVPILYHEWRRNAIIIMYTIPWIFLAIGFPIFYLNNTYYHYPMLYGMSILLAFFVFSTAEKLSELEWTNLRWAGFLLLMLTLASTLVHYNTFFHSQYTDFSKANETEPFESAKYVNIVNTKHELVVADLPMTMFYLGGDPAYIKLAYTTQGLIDAVKEDKYTYLVTYYEGNRTLKETLEEYNYTQIAPRAWEKSQ